MDDLAGEQVQAIIPIADLVREEKEEHSNENHRPSHFSQENSSVRTNKSKDGLIQFEIGSGCYSNNPLILNDYGELQVKAKLTGALGLTRKPSTSPKANSLHTGADLRKPVSRSELPTNLISDRVGADLRLDSRMQRKQ